MTEIERNYMAEYEDGDFEVFGSFGNDDAVTREAMEYEPEHGILFNVFELNGNYYIIRTVF